MPTNTISFAHAGFMNSPFAMIAGSVFTVLLATACLSDVTTRRIPDWIITELAFTGLMYTVLVTMSFRALVTHGLLGMLVGLLLWIPFYTIGWLKTGDVRLFAATGAWLGPLYTTHAAIVSASIGGVLVLMWMLLAYGVRSTLARTPITITLPTATLLHASVPYGIALAIGALLIGWFPSLGVWIVRAAY